MTTAVRQRMTHRALVERRTDSDGRYDVPTWGTLTEALPCWLVMRSGVEAVSPEATVVVQKTTLIVPLNTDIREADRVNGIKNRLGVTILGGVMDVTNVDSHHDHLEVTLDLVKGGA